MFMKIVFTDLLNEGKIPRLFLEGNTNPLGAAPGRTDLPNQTRAPWRAL